MSEIGLECKVCVNRKISLTKYICQLKRLKFKKLQGICDVFVCNKKSRTVKSEKEINTVIIYHHTDIQMTCVLMLGGMELLLLLYLLSL